MRLEVHAPPKQAPIAAAKLVAWLTADRFDADVLEREKNNVASELSTTVPRGFTHKWAAAAWAQVVRHGAKEVAVLGDVQGATVDGLEGYAEARVALGPDVRIVAVGPLPPAEVKTLFDAQLASGGGLDALAGALGGKARAAKEEHGSASGAPDSALARGELAAAWDLPATHLLEWYLLPDATPADRASATLLANALSTKLQADAELPSARILALASADVVVPRGRVLLLSASLPDAAAKERAAAAFRRAIDGLEALPHVGSLDALLEMARNELSGLPDFSALRKQWKSRPGATPPGAPAADLLEAQIGLQVALREASTGLSFAELGAAAKALTSKQLLDRRAKLLDAALASRLLLLPRS